MRRLLDCLEDIYQLTLDAPQGAQKGTIMALPATFPSSSLEDLLEDARLRIEVTDPELDEARKRRDAIGAALRAEFPGSETYVNGSVAHGDALTPLTDVDLGIIVSDAELEHGPGLKGPLNLMNRAAEAIRERLRPMYGDLSVQVQGRKRSVLIRFRDPVAAGLPDFTADVIVAIDNVDDDGLFIPRVPGWDRSHPQKHTALVRQANETSEVCFARAVRLLKHWSRTNGKPLCSWNIKALALGCLLQPTCMMAALVRWFEYAADELDKGETRDPAGVAPNPIKLNPDFTRREVVRKLWEAAGWLRLAEQRERDGYLVLAHELLAKTFNDPEMLPWPDPRAVRVHEAERIRSERLPRAGASGPYLVTGTGEGSARPRRDVDSWAP
jgi:hypothetical protein